MQNILTKIFIRKFLFTVFGVQIVRNPHRGIELHHDLTASIPGVSINTIFDVGANNGDSALEFRQWYPTAYIHCFEPARQTFEILGVRTRGDRNIRISHLALGSTCAEVNMSICEDDPRLSRIQGINDIAEVDSTSPSEVIDMTTLDQYCKDLGIENIDLLKIDTEGFDEEVLLGATEFLKTNSIKVVQVECGMNPGNDVHVRFERLKKLLEAQNYMLFGIYEQVEEWKTLQPHLRRVNAVYVSEVLL